MKLRQILAGVAAGALAVSAMATSVSAEQVTVEKILFANDANVGTVKFETTVNLGNYNVSSSSGGQLILSLPKSVTVDYADAPLLDKMNLYIQARSLEINGVKPFDTAANDVVISSDTNILIQPGLFDNKDLDGVGTATVRNPHRIQISAATANKYTIKGTFVHGKQVLSDDETTLLSYADKLTITPSSVFSFDIRAIQLYRIDSEGRYLPLEDANHPYRNTAPISLEMKNVSTFDGSDTTKTSIVKADAFTVSEKEAIKADGAQIQLQVELANQVIGTAALSYVQLDIVDAVRSTYADVIKLAPRAATIQGNTATFELSKSDIYQEAYDEFNREFIITADQGRTNTVNNYIKTAKIIVSYDDGTILESEDVLDSEDEPEPEIEDADFDEMPVDEEEIIEEEDDFIEDDFTEDDFTEDDEDDLFEDELENEGDIDFEEEITDETSDDEGSTEGDVNPKTGVALAIVPALIAGAGVVIARKRK